ncbi:serine hydrolase domain-containing protein [Mycobacterium montefiorense]|uniref:Esterase n=1 Tax=Mycobacterium montefiorense TaxID=154654 RepID=A0AA37PMW3_9MYCO|nr:serine hydrolase domain-containing protein [Mycobacterium montefiorense]GBG37510.1 esterase [Mycobacterium montefiorense]GKU35349.1 esterase [Mycobacterium montefiorense]GKU42367.1 esterase [Mycobacterium montefiorense]GKU47808.1 esterase [Mycobacterium montefiorense]GKU52801.1 esterase [Mycobacterium montefiorense]
MSDLKTDVDIQGSCASDFTGVRDAFERNFAQLSETGAAVAVWVDGDLVVNLWGGSADAAGTRAWQQDTLTTVLSGTKGLSATCLHQLADRGEVDLHTPIARYWPEFGQAGKEDITLAMVISHRSGVIGPRTPMSWQQVCDWDYVCEQLIVAEPWWEPGTAQGYHMTTFGFIVGEVFRRVTGRTIGQYLRTEIAEPLGADVHIGLSDADQLRCAERVNKPHMRDLLTHIPSNPTSLDEHPKAGLAVSMGFTPDDEVSSYDLELWRRLEFPGTNGQVSALGLATFYNALAQEKLLSREHMDLIRVSQGGFEPDLVLGPRVADHGWGLGYMLNQRHVNGPNPRIFGHGGLGGSFGFVDLEHRIGYAYVANRFDATKSNADPRSLALSNEVYAVLGVDVS